MIAEAVPTDALAAIVAGAIVLGARITVVLYRRIGELRDRVSRLEGWKNGRPAPPA